LTTSIGIDVQHKLLGVGKREDIILAGVEDNWIRRNTTNDILKTVKKEDHHTIGPWKLILSRHLIFNKRFSATETLAPNILVLALGQSKLE
jgi:hypothetical protein